MMPTCYNSINNIVAERVRQHPSAVTHRRCIPMSTDYDITAAHSKACARCGEVKSLSEFWVESKARDGRRASCRACQSVLRGAARNGPVRDRQNTASAAYYAANRDRLKAAVAAYRLANAEKIKAAKAAHYAANRDRVLTRNADWRLAHPEAVRINNDRRRARQHAVGTERIYRAQVWERDNGRCHICGRTADPKNWHLDHIVPISRGGEHSYRNVAVSHPSCNLRKGATGPAQLRLRG